MKIKKNGKVINLTESDLKRIVKKVLNEEIIYSNCEGEVFNSDICGSMEERPISEKGLNIVNKITKDCACFNTISDWNEESVKRELEKIDSKKEYDEISSLLFCYMKGAPSSPFSEMDANPITTLIDEITPDWQILDNTDWSGVKDMVRNYRNDI